MSTSCVPSIFCVTSRLNLLVLESSSYRCTANCGLSASVAAGMTYVLPGNADSLMDRVTIGSMNRGRLSFTSSMYTVTLTTCSRHHMRHHSGVHSADINNSSTNSCRDCDVPQKFHAGAFVTSNNMLSENKTEQKERNK